MDSWYSVPQASGQHIETSSCGLLKNLQGKLFYIMETLAIIIPDNGVKISKITNFRVIQQTLNKIHSNLL